jgi:hypothetical protein
MVGQLRLTRIIKYEDADLAAEKPIAAERQGQKIVVEIKSFIGRSRFV